MRMWAERVAEDAETMHMRSCGLTWSTLTFLIWPRRWNSCERLCGVRLLATDVAVVVAAAAAAAAADADAAALDSDLSGRASSAAATAIDMNDCRLDREREVVPSSTGSGVVGASTIVSDLGLTSSSSVVATARPGAGGGAGDGGCTCT